MPNTIRTTPITTPTRLALLVLGAISLSAAMASPASAQAVDPNASGCRSAIGIIVSRGCLSAKPENNGAARDRSNAGGAGGGYTAMPTDAKTKALLRDPLIDSPGVANYDSHGKITSVDYPELGIHDTSIPGGIMRQYPDSLTEQDWEVLRRRHPGGDSQIKALLANTQAFADSYDDMNFTPPFLSTIQARTLIVQGDRDPLYPVEISVEMARAIPRASLWIVPNAGHGPIGGDRWPEFVKTASAFLRVPTAKELP